MQPTFDHAALQTVTELTRASVEALVEDLDSTRVEVHKTFPLWLLARNTARLSVRDPAGGTRLDLTRYLGAFVTPNASPESVEPQVRALYEALGESLVAHYQIGEQVEPALCRRHAIRDLRVLEGITPME